MGKKYKGLVIGKISCDFSVATNDGCIQGVISDSVLKHFGEKLLKDSFLSDVHYYQIALPSENVPKSSHAVAFMIDHKNKIMKYHDSHGVDMRREIKDFLMKLFPDYKIDINYSVQQADIVSNKDWKKNDNSCVLLSLYNLRDMWFEKNGMPDKVCNFDSMSARKDAWNILSKIPSEVKKQNTFSFGKLIVKDLEEEQQQQNFDNHKEEKEKWAFKYRLYNEPNYDDLINKAVDTVRAEIQKWHNEKTIQQNGGGRV